MRRSIFIILFICLCLFIFVPRYKIKPNKNHINLVYYGEDYIEEGAGFYSCNLFKCSLITDEITIIGEIDSNKIGHYEVRYEYIFKNKLFSAIRSVKVIDIESPTITLIDDNRLYLSVGSKYVEKGAYAVDNYDGDLTDSILVSGSVDTRKVGTYLINYKSIDSSNNESVISREVIVYDDSKAEIIKDTNAIDDIEDYISSKKLSVSIVYYDVLNGYMYIYNPNKVYYGCSLIKTLDAMYTYENMKITDTIRSLVKKAIEVSDNDAHYSLVSKIGRENLKKYGEKIGANNVLTTKDTYGNTTVYDQLAYMKHLFKLINTLDNKDELKSFFINNFKNYISFENSPTMLHKYGRISGVYYHESAIVLDDKPYIVSILSQEDDRKSVITELSKKIYDMHKEINQK